MAPPTPGKKTPRDRPVNPNIDFDFELTRSQNWETPKTPKTPNASKSANPSTSASHTGATPRPVSAAHSTNERSRTAGSATSHYPPSSTNGEPTPAGHSDYSSRPGRGGPSRTSSAPYQSDSDARFSRSSAANSRSTVHNNIPKSRRRAYQADATLDRGEGAYQGAFNFPILPGFPQDIEDGNEEPDEAQYESIEGFVRDNDADRAERAGVPPDASFQLPIKRHPEFDARFFGPRNSNLRHIAYKTSTHLSMPTVVDDHVILMWGLPAQISAAKLDLHSLYEQVSADIDQGQRRVGGWQKINAAPTDRKQSYLDKVAREGLMKEKYKKMPKEGQFFSVIGVFVWPVKEVPPQSVLGTSFEALDAIRTEHSVYILFNRKKSMFRVMGDDADMVNQAVDRIHGIFCEVACKSRRPNKLCLVHPPTKDVASTTVRLNPHHDLVDRQITVTRLEQNKGIQVYLDGRQPSRRWKQAWIDKRAKLQKANETYIKKVLQQGIQDVSYFRGHVKLKIYFGRLVLFGYKKAKDGEYSLDEFMENIRSPQTAGELIRHLGNPEEDASDKEVAERLIKNCTAKPDVFQPVEIGSEIDRNNALQSGPSISATFELSLFDNNGKTQDVRLEVNFEPIPGAHRRDLANGLGDLYKPGQRRWLCLPSGDKQANNINRRKGPVDIKVLDVESDIAYQIELAHWSIHRDTDIYAIFRQFCNRLRVEEISDEWDDETPAPEPGRPDRRRKIHRVTFVNFPGINVIALTQKTKWAYWVQNTSYIFEVTKYEHLPVQEVRDLYPDGVPISYSGLKGDGHDTRWGAALFNDEWNEQLSQQRSVELGKRGLWDSDIDAFFSPSGAGHLDNSSAPEWHHDGVAELLGRINEFVNMIKEAQEEVGRSKRHDDASTFVGTEEYDE